MQMKPVHLPNDIYSVYFLHETGHTYAPVSGSGAEQEMYYF